MPKPIYSEYLVAEVVNLRTPKGQNKALNTEFGYLYIGRGVPNGAGNILTVEPTENGWLGNPYRLEDYRGNRSKVIKLFEIDFNKRLKDPKFRKALLGILKDCRKPKMILGCFCHPLACHGHVIANWINGRKIKWR